MKTRRILGVLLSAAITLCAVTGCGDKQNNSYENTVPFSTDYAASESESPTQTENNVQYDEVVFYQNPSCKITFCGIDTSEKYLNITYTAENIGNEKICYDSSTVIINDFEMYNSNNFYLSKFPK